jgi:hypothetical protein
MAMESPAWTLLAAYAPLVALVPAARIRKSGYAGESPVAPYITIQEIGGAPQNYVAERPGIDSFRPTIKVVAVTEASAKTIAAHVRDALELRGYCELFIGPEFEVESKLFICILDWRFYVSR